MTNINTPLPPNNEEAEWAVLSAMLINPDAIPEVASILVKEAFYRTQPRFIFQAILDLADKREPVDVLTVSEELRRTGKLEDVGGIDTLFSLQTAFINSVLAKHYAHIVYDAYRRRNLINAASKIAQLAYDESESLVDVVSQSQGLLFNASENVIASGPRSIKDIARKRLDDIERLSNGEGNNIGIPTGLLDVDRMLGGGLSRSDLILIAARPGMGKTALLMTMADHAASKEKKTVGIWAMEMSGEQLVDRAVAMRSEINTQRLRKGELHEREWPLFFETIGALSETHIFIDDTPRLRPSQLAARARKLHMQHGLDLIMVDYLQLMEADSRTDNRVQEVSEISRALKNLARELDVPVVAAAQLSRAVENRQDKRPQLSDLRDSGSLEQDADIVMFIYRDEYYNPETTERPNIAELNFAKHRNGPTGTIGLYWSGSLTRFRDLAWQEVRLNGSGETTHAAATADQY